MRTYCFSAAPILRCESLSVIQYGLLIVPPVIELLFANVLLFTFWGSRREYLFLVAEAWIYMTLVLLDSLSHMVPAARGSFAISSSIDIALGTLSFLPLLLFMLFLYLFMRARFIIALPIRLRNLTKMVLLIFVPLIIVANEIASFIGISRQPAQDGDTTAVDLGFTSDNKQLLWTFFTSFTLAIFVAFQSLCFFLAFYRVVRAIVNQRNIETSAVDAVHFMRGTAWIAIGLKLGAVETLIGFAECGFSVAIIRRLIRVISRACLILGMIKGMDAVEDFRWLEKSNRRLIRKSSRVAQSQEPVDDTRLERVSTLSEEIPDVPPIKLPLVLPRSQGERVTVHYDKDQAPTLRLRFSFIDLPTASVLENAFRSRQPQEEFDFASPSTPSQIEILSLGDVFPNSVVPVSAKSYYGESVSISEPRFPPAAKVHGIYPLPTSVRTRTTFGFEPPAPTPYTPIPETSTSTLPSPLRPAALNSARSVPLKSSSPKSAYDKRPRLSAVGKSFLTLSRSNTVYDTPVSPHPDHQPSLQRNSTLPDNPRSPSSSAGSTQDGSRRSQPQLVIPHSMTISPAPQPQYYMTPPSSADTGNRSRPRHRGTPNRDFVWIKSIGTAPRKNTPIPTPVEDTRASIAVQSILSPQASSSINPLASRTNSFMRYGSLVFPSPPLSSFLQEP